MTPVTYKRELHVQLPHILGRSESCNASDDTAQSNLMRTVYVEPVLPCGFLTGKFLSSIPLPRVKAIVVF